MVPDFPANDPETGAEFAETEVFRRRQAAFSANFRAVSGIFAPRSSD
jgi:hypothetical protein